LRGFLAAAGLAGAVAVAVAQQPGNTRAAGLLPPRPLDASEAAPVARGAAPDAPTSATTPVPRSNAKAPAPTASGPAWLTGVDPNVLPTAGNTSIGSSLNKPGVVTAGPLGSGLGTGASRPTPPRDEPASGKGIERFKLGTGGPERTPNDAKSQPDTPNANTPFRGTGANGAPVYAGPPAYRWYGYGSVTPGANPYAPNGAYPKASANWYNVTGATPGAFPVPVMNPLRQPPGIDPPSYATTPGNRNQGVISTSSPPLGTNPPAPGSTMPLITSLPPVPPTDVKVIPLPGPSSVEPPRTSSPPFTPITPSPVTTTPISAPVRPEPSTSLSVPSTPVGVPTIATPPGVGATLPLPPIPERPTEPARETPRAPVGLVPPVGIVPPLRPSEPATQPMPLTLTKPAGEEPRWQPGEPPGPPEGTWAPAAGQPKQVNQPGAMRPGHELRIRAQMPDDRSQKDPTADLVREVCRGRATGIEIRWTGPKRLAVCFESPNEPEAARLVKDVSARRELAPLQIDFCVLVK
jgi:hypothetical protein